MKHIKDFFSIIWIIVLDLWDNLTKPKCPHCGSHCNGFVIDFEEDDEFYKCLDCCKCFII